jgi:type II secretory pathway pseudopilin PulG
MNRVSKKAFTIVELLVAVGLLVAMMAASVAVFRTAIDAQQKASSTGDYMNAIAAVTNQIREDFSSIDVDAPFAIWFNADGSDRAFFFASGRFEQLSGGNLDTDVQVDNYGAIHYAVDSNMLLRDFLPADRYQQFIVPSANANDEREDLRNLLGNVIDYDEDDHLTYSRLLSNRVESFKVQMLYGSNDGTVRWYPDENPYPQLADDSDYDLMGNNFGVFFNIDADANSSFYPPRDLQLKLIRPDGTLDNAVYFNHGYKPLAFKFTITLTDPNDKLEDKVFTYVVKF